MKANRVALIEAILGFGFWIVFAIYSGLGKQLPPY